MTNMHQTLKDWGTSTWGGGGPVVTLQDADKRLCDACRDGNLEGVKAALEDGAQPGVQFRLALGEVTPIFLCSQKGYMEIAEVLIKHGASLVKRMDFDQTICLHHAASNDQPRMCAFLIEKGCDVNAKDRLGRTPLMDAAEIGSVEAVTVLLENAADINIEDNESHMALSYCIDFVSKREPRFYETAKLLVARNADVSARGKFANRTILHCAAAQGDFDFVKELVDDRGAHPLVYDNDHKTPAHYASMNSHGPVEEYLNQRAQEMQSGCCAIL